MCMYVCVCVCKCVMFLFTTSLCLILCVLQCFFYIFIFCNLLSKYSLCNVLGTIKYTIVLMIMSNYQCMYVVYIYKRVYVKNIQIYEFVHGYNQPRDTHHNSHSPSPQHYSSFIKSKYCFKCSFLYNIFLLKPLALFECFFLFQPFFLRQVSMGQ